MSRGWLGPAAAAAPNTLCYANPIWSRNYLSHPLLFTCVRHAVSGQPPVFGPNPDDQRPVYVLQNIPIIPQLRHAGPTPNPTPNSMPNSRPFGGLCVGTPDA